jgi:hypothetical protein
VKILELSSTTCRLSTPLIGSQVISLLKTFKNNHTKHHNIIRYDKNSKKKKKKFLLLQVKKLHAS